MVFLNSIDFNLASMDSLSYGSWSVSDISDYFIPLIGSVFVLVLFAKLLVMDGLGEKHSSHDKHIIKNSESKLRQFENRYNTFMGIPIFSSDVGCS